jgi:DNA-binding MarR family transcriptional regulator
MSSGETDRAELLLAFNREIRQSSALGVMFSQTVAARLGITSTDLECLDFIGLKGVMTAGQLAEATGLTTGAVTGILDRLEKAGFARRERDTQDRRKVLVRALPALGQEIGPYYASLAAAMDELMSRYGDDELKLLLDFATRSHVVMVNELSKLKARPLGKASEVRPGRKVAKK